MYHTRAAARRACGNNSTTRGSAQDEDSSLARNSLPGLEQPKEEQGSTLLDNGGGPEAERSIESVKRLIIEAKKRKQLLKLEGELTRLEEEIGAIVTSTKRREFDRPQPSPTPSTSTTLESLPGSQYEDANESDYFQTASSTGSSKTGNRLTKADWEREKGNIRRKYMHERQTRYSLLVYLRDMGFQVSEKKLKIQLRKWGFRKNRKPRNQRNTAKTQRVRRARRQDSASVQNFTGTAEDRQEPDPKEAHERAVTPSSTSTPLLAVTPSPAASPPSAINPLLDPTQTWDDSCLWHDQGCGSASMFPYSIVELPCTDQGKETIHGGTNWSPTELSQTSVACWQHYQQSQLDPTEPGDFGYCPWH